MQKMTKEQAERILGLNGTYTASDLRSVYVKLAKEYHPDAQGKNNAAKQTACEYMQEINAAHSFLKKQFKNGNERVHAGVSGNTYDYTPNSNTRWTNYQSQSSDDYAKAYSKAYTEAHAGDSTTNNKTANSANNANNSKANAANTNNAANTSDNTNNANVDNVASDKADANNSSTTETAQNGYVNAAYTWKNVYSQYKENTSAVDPENVNAYAAANAAYQAAKQATEQAKANETAREQQRAAKVAGHKKTNVVYKILSHLPYRLMFLAIVLFLFIQPEHAGMDYVMNFGTMGWMTLYNGDFNDLLLWHGLVVLAFLNMAFPIVTTPIRSLLLTITSCVAQAVDDLKN